MCYFFFAKILNISIKDKKTVLLRAFFYKIIVSSHPIYRCLSFFYAHNVGINDSRNNRISVEMRVYNYFPINLGEFYNITIQKFSSSLDIACARLYLCVRCTKNSSERSLACLHYHIKE